MAAIVKDVEVAAVRNALKDGILRVTCADNQSILLASIAALH